MSSNIDDLTINYTDDEGQQIIKEIDKAILTRGAWTTIMFMYQEWDRRAEVWSENRVRIERYQKRSGEYRSASKFKINTAKQVEQIVDVLKGWYSL